MEKSQAQDLNAPLQSALGDNQRALFDSAIKNECGATRARLLTFSLWIRPGKSDSSAALAGA
jgi:hypothetical protein